MIHHCSTCETAIVPVAKNYRYSESGINQVVLQGVDVADCPVCGNSDVIIPNMERIHQAIAAALLRSPVRLTGPQLRFLRKHLGKSGEELASYLHTDKTKISKWEQGKDPIGPSVDRLVRLLVAAIDPELEHHSKSVAEHLRDISDRATDVELHIDSRTLLPSFLNVKTAA
jgi:putative zinc finger/helix-turn-helix YgiT family protein